MSPYASFDDKGYTFQADLPASDAEPLAFRVRISVGESEKYRLFIPMVYPPRFGVDVGDIQQLEAVADEVLGLLPAPADFQPTTIQALDALETKLGGQEAKAWHAAHPS
jgi:hypothetical protein